MAGQRSGFPGVVHPHPATDEEERKASFARYVVPEIDVLYRVALTLVDRPADAEDLVQDTLLRAYRGLTSFDGRHPRAWLLTILRNAHRNRSRRRRPDLLRDPEFQGAAATADGSPSPEGLVVDHIFDPAVASAVETLPLKMRRVLELVDLDGLSYEEAALALAVPVGTVMSRLHRARSRIRERLAASQVVPRRGS
ncbi:MAG: sigma-70 family RNA polymerase sigma factor [Acidimicrobiales bacterium]